MRMYTEEQVQSIIQRNLELAEENVVLKDKLSNETAQREEAEKRYFNLCEGCITAYMSERDITTDSFLVQVTVPRFMSDYDFEVGVAKTICTNLVKERERVIFNSTMTQTYKPKE